MYDVAGLCVGTVTGALEGLFTDPLGLVPPDAFCVTVRGSVLLEVAGRWVVTGVVTGAGVGCPVKGCPVQLPPSADMFIPLGQRHV